MQIDLDIHIYTNYGLRSVTEVRTVATTSVFFLVLHVHILYIEINFPFFLFPMSYKECWLVVHCIIKLSGL